MQRKDRRTPTGLNDLSGAEGISPRDPEKCRQTEIQRFLAPHRRARGPCADFGRLSRTPCRSIRPHWKTGASHWSWRTFRRDHARKRPDGSAVGRAVPAANVLLEVVVLSVPFRPLLVLHLSC